MFRNTTDIKGIVFHYIDEEAFTEEELQDIKEIYFSNEWKSLFLVESASNIIRQLDFVDPSDYLRITPFEMWLWPSVKLFEQVVKHLGLSSSEIILISKDSVFTNRSMSLLCGVVLVSQMVSYNQLSYAPDAIFRNYKQFYDLALKKSAGRNYFGENRIPIVLNEVSSRVFFASYQLDEKLVNIFALGRYYGSKHYMHDLHPYSKALISNKSESSRLFSRFNHQFVTLIKKTINNFHKIDYRADALCYVPPRPDERSRFEPIFEVLFSDTSDERIQAQDISHTLVSTRHFEKQKLLGREGRQANVEGAFLCTENLSGKHVLVVDDVITTGATLEACARALYDVGAESVSFFVFAINQYEQSGLTSEYAAVCPSCGHNLHLIINSRNCSPFYACPECRMTYNFDVIMADLNRRIDSK